MQERYDEGLVILKKALKIYRRVLGESHEKISQVIQSIANNLARQGRYEEAYQKYEQSRDCYYRTLGRNHPDVAFLQFEMYTCNLNLGAHTEATVCLREAHRIYLMHGILNETSQIVAAAIHALDTSSEQC